ncbi:hypothetical protein [Paraliobacillus sp. X-1268]|uniref:hypothetical protein n=1 Tax=Paraliobacillus sp. X-1268 TaxID=2213193 RepID=UPI000E3E65A3|nr:hypothetical protein [Paraliobacillus sp. X-1268]
MLKEAIKFLQQLSIKPDERFVDVVDANGQDRHFSVDEDGRAYEIKPFVSRAESALKVNTLTGLVEYIKANLERNNQNLFLQVFDENNVVLKGVLDSEGERESLVMAKAIVPSFGYDHYYDSEEMIIAFQSKFKQTKDRDLLLKVIGNIQEENVRQTGDTGIAQAVTIKTGISSADDVQVPNPVRLAPYRTFLEVEQPVSDFIFRMKEGPRGAIFEADGGAWRNQAIVNVRDYLKEELEKEVKDGRITIIA